jgi:hypothetical protein
MHGVNPDPYSSYPTTQQLGITLVDIAMAECKRQVMVENFATIVNQAKAAKTSGSRDADPGATARILVDRVKEKTNEEQKTLAGRVGNFFSAFRNLIRYGEFKTSAKYYGDWANNVLQKIEEKKLQQYINECEKKQQPKPSKSSSVHSPNKTIPLTPNDEMQKTFCTVWEKATPEEQEFIKRMTLGLMFKNPDVMEWKKDPKDDKCYHLTLKEATSNEIKENETSINEIKENETSIAVITLERKVTVRFSEEEENGEVRFVLSLEGVSIGDKGCIGQNIKQLIFERGSGSPSELPGFDIVTPNRVRYKELLSKSFQEQLSKSFQEQIE